MHAAPETLNDLVEFFCPFTIIEGGEVIAGPSEVHAPEYLNGELDSDEWTPVTGYSGQYGYTGPVMHDSEYLGGRMAQDVLESPGVYVIIPADYEDGETANEYEYEGWLLLKRK